jgi:hypothetical protein
MTTHKLYKLASQGYETAALSVVVETLILLLRIGEARHQILAHRLADTTEGFRGILQSLRANAGIVA